VLSALASQSRLLPDCSDTLYVLDEAHHLPEAAIARFAVGHPVAGAVKWLDKLPAVIQRCSVMLPDGQRHLDILEPIRQLGDELRNLYKALAAREGFKENAAWRFPHGVLPPDFATFATEISSLAAAVLSSTVSLHEALSDERKESEGKEALNKAMQEFGFFIPKITNLNDTWTMVTASEEPPIAKWIERVERGTSVDFSVSAAPISAAKTLSEALWKQAAGVCLTSATVTSLGNFDYFLRSTGLDRFKQVETLDVPSPFDYASQGVFVVPPMKTSPTDAIKHTAELCTAVPSELERVAHGALVLFTSKRQMEQVYGALPATIQSDVLMQGTMIRSVMLDAHRKRVGAGARSILFGLQGLGEGLDLPGQLCEVVIIAKLPFSPPDSPIEEARAEYLERNNRNPFNEITVPAVGLKMQQWTGRGIRTETDTARIVCMDSRLQSKAYGKLILRGLPPFRREIAVAA
jgi:ATP-dependent DNA helicase DinG